MESDYNSTKFLQTIYSFSYIPAILKPARVTEHSASIIDNIFVNLCIENIVAGLIYDDISDLFPTFAFIPLNNSNVSNIDTTLSNIEIRNLPVSNLNKLKQQHTNFDWTPLYSTRPNCIDSQYSYFVTTYLDILNSCCPFKSIAPRNVITVKPWISSGLLKSIKTKSMYYKRSLCKPLF